MPIELPPLAELHCHIEGACPPSLARSQAEKYGASLDGLIDGDAYVWRDFTTFLDVYGRVAALFRTPEDYALLTETYLASLAADGCIYSELFIAPVPPYVPTLHPEAYLEGMIEGIARARAKTGIECRMIVVGIRHEGADAVMAAARFAARHRSDLLTGFGMAGEERMHYPSDFVEAFNIARDAGLHITVHAGELAGPQSVRDALDHLSPERIGHGVRAIEDASLVEHLAESGVTLECCPGSNVALGIYPDFERHPIVALREAGVKVTISSDDPPYFATSLARDHREVARAYDLSKVDLRAFTRTAIEAAFCDAQTRARLLATLGADI